MIAGIGNDLISVARVEEMISKSGEKFINRIFTKIEINQADALKNKSNFFAKRFAAKEAFSKALGLGIGRGVNFLDIEVFNDDFGKPQIRILNKKEQFVLEYLKCQKIKIHLSLSDEKNMAMATAIIEAF